MEGLELHRGSLARILRRQPEGQPQDKITPVDRPILQVLDAKVVSKGGHDERLRVILNDGDFKSEAAMFAHQARRQYGAAPPLSVVRIVDYFTSFVQMEHHHDQKRLLMICLNVEIMSMSVPAVIGNPCDLPHVMERAPTAAPEGPSGGAALGQPGSYGGPPPVAAMGQGIVAQGSSGATYAQPSSIGGHQPARVAHGGEYGQQQSDRKPAHWLPGQQGGGMQGGAWGQASGGHPQYGQPASSYGGQAQQPYGGANPSHGGTPAPSWDHGVAGGNPASGGQYRPPASYSNNQAPIARNEAPARFQPVRSLNMYQNGWAIKARVTSKSELRRWSNQRGEGTILSFDVTDDQGGEIRCTAFNELAQKFNHEVHEGRVYSIRGGGIKRKRAQFNHLNSEFEISLDRNSKVEEVMEDAQTAAIPMVHFQFVPIEQLAMAEVGSVVDVLGVVDRVEPAATIQRRDQTSTEKRPLVVKDQSGVSIELTLWGNYAHSPGDDIEARTGQGQHPILAIKGARVGDFNGKSLSTIGSSKILVEPVIAEADALRDWYLQQGGATQAARSLSSAGGSGRVDRQCSLATIRNEGLGTRGAPDYVSVFAAVSTIKRSPLMYPSCPLQRAGRLCKKKMQPQDGGTAYFCEACGASAEPQWTYCASVTIMDHTGSESGVMCFQEAESLHQMECEANETGCDDAIIAHIVKCQNRSYHLKLKVAEETWQETPRIRLQVSRADTVAWAQESQNLLRAIRSLELGEAIMQAKDMSTRSPQPGAGGYGQVPGYGGGSQGSGAGGYGAGHGGRPAPSGSGGFQGGAGGGYGAAAPSRYGPPQDYSPGVGGSGWGGGGSAWGRGGPENVHSNGGAAFSYHGQGPAVGKSYGPAM